MVPWWLALPALAVYGALWAIVVLAYVTVAAVAFVGLLVAELVRALDARLHT